MSKSAKIQRLSSMTIVLALAWSCSFVGLCVISSSVPAQAVSTYNNATIADKALTYKGEWGGEACRDAHKLDQNGTTVGGYNGGECRTFVNCVVFMASGGAQYPTGSDYFQSFLNAGGTRIADISQLSKGDIVQVVWPSLHTFIIVRRVSGNTFNVVDSNSALNLMVRNYNRTFSLSNTTRAYRMGTVRAGTQRRVRPDFTGDGKADIAWYEQSQNAITVLKSTGHGFTGAWKNEGIGGPTWAGVGDFTGDGKADVAWYEQWQNAITVLKSTGHGFNGAWKNEGIGGPTWAGVT
jgi:hypothetical protein